MTLQELKKKLSGIKTLGFVKTHRKGDTGIGKTLEDLLGIKENNIPLPDIGEIAELKAYRKSAVSMLTLFTLEPQPKGGDRDRTLLDGFGYSKRDNGRSKELHSTL
ncbi:MAG: glycosyl hydrolase, partial [Candidatus Yonathbacteria bacterium CG_4_10_14_3_um_filter_43_12]